MYEKVYDVVIIGAGPVGLTCALELNRQGITNILVLEKLTELSPYAKASNIHCGTFDLLRNYPDLITRIGPELNIIKNMHFEEIQGDHLKLVNEISIEDKNDYKVTNLGMWMHGQYKTQIAMLDVLEKHSVEVRWGVKVTDLVQHKEGVYISIEDQNEVISCKWMVGCDGGHSFVRDKLNIPKSGGPIDDFRLIVCHLEVDHMDPIDNETGYLLTVEKPIDMVIFPMLDNHLYLGMPQSLEESKVFETELDHYGRMNVREPSEEEILSRISPLLKLKNFIVKKIKWKTIFRMNSFVSEEYRVGRVFIAGDACHTHPPIGGRGMNTGIQDAINLGWKLALELKGFKGVGDYKLIQSYHDERYPIGKQLCDSTLKSAKKVGLIENFSGFMKNFLTGVAAYIPAQVLVGNDPADTFMYGNYYRESPICMNIGEVNPHCIMAGDRITMAITKIKELCVGTAGFKVLLLLDKHVGKEFVCCLWDIFNSDKYYITETLIYTAIDKMYWNLKGEKSFKYAGTENIDLLKIYGVKSTGLFLIRPDCYVAYKSEPADLYSLIFYLNKHLRKQE